MRRPVRYDRISPGRALDLLRRVERHVSPFLGAFGTPGLAASDIPGRNSARIVTEEVVEALDQHVRAALFPRRRRGS